MTVGDSARRGTRLARGASRVDEKPRALAPGLGQALDQHVDVRRCLRACGQNGRFCLGIAG